MAYNVYRVEYRLGLQDPLMGPEPRAHNALFVETEQNGDGRILQVSGTITQPGGMYFEEDEEIKPENSETYLRKHYLGQIKAAQYGSVVHLLRSIPAPPLQRDFDPNTKSWVPCKPDKSRYGPGEDVPPYIKCTEWTLQKAIPTLQQSGFLYPNGVPQSQPPVQATEEAAPQT
ncbi:hypothetical protein CC80DRAFT_547022 [Byssothecium circinans]|uniref:Uncharacterized protein n=1 Tax=Byssothecium circinans TaxID=147558 RepID=A0A6A5U4P9_9PLEO|nr:hypothetical protein CC80DRAFT_547022 [Byssothecium circinans]